MMYRKLGKEIKKAFRQDDVMGILLNSPLQSGPFDGGCLVVAKALCSLFPEFKLVVLVRRAEGKTRILDHYAAMCPDGGLIDADGYASSPANFIKRFIKNEHLKHAHTSYVVEPGFPNLSPDIDYPRTVKDLVRVLRLFLDLWE